MLIHIAFVFLIPSPPHCAGFSKYLRQIPGVTFQYKSAWLLTYL